VAQLPATRALIFRPDASDGQRQFNIPLIGGKSESYGLEWMYVGTIKDLRVCIKQECP